uniref:VIgL family C1q-related protein 10 n=1 Tax=Littorina littorea TaxID=31216 RepID=A0A411DEK5_LITLI|nr:VIgL family C1q-related protein 10 [Littorina littorea]
MVILRVLCLVFLTFLPGYTALTWSDDLKDGQPVYACAGANLLLPWNVSKATTEGIEDIKWFYSGRSQEMIAIFANGNFLSMPSYADRVLHVTTGGLYLRHVQVSDTGNYSIEVSGHDASGAFVTHRHTAVVRVGDSLMTTDGDLHVREEVKAMLDNSDQQFHVVLSCGTFTYLTYPPFEVEWTHPDGSQENSSTYNDGKFQLLLANPIKGGNYSCRIPAHSAAAACLPGHTPKPVVAGISVDSMEGRLTVMEAQQSALKEDNSGLKIKLSDLRTEFSDYKNDTENGHVSFYARGSSSTTITYAQPFPLPTVSINQGNGYTASTGKFAVPVNGIYFFAATMSSGQSSTASNTYRTNAGVVVDGTMVCTIQSPVNGEVGSCQAVVELHVGQSAWLRCGNNYNCYFNGPVTSFTGFLISQA